MIIEFDNSVDDEAVNRFMIEGEATFNKLRIGGFLPYQYCLLYLCVKRVKTADSTIMQWFNLVADNCFRQSIEYFFLNLSIEEIRQIFNAMKEEIY